MSAPTCGSEDPGPATGLWADLRASLAGGERDWTHMEPRRAVVLLAVPMMLEMALESVFFVVDIYYVARLGPAAIATVGLTEAMMTILFAVAIGLATATTALVARRVGEGDLEGAAETAVQSLALGLLVSVAIGGGGALAARPLLAAMGASGEVLAIGTSYATYTVAIRIILFTFLPSWGLSNAAATLVGQNLGAGRPAEAERSVWLTARYNVAFLGTVGLVFLAVPGPLLRPFTRDPEVLAVAVECLRWLGASYGFFAFGLVAIQAFNGAGDTATPMRLKFACYWLWQIPVAWGLSVEAGLGPRGVFAAIVSAEVLLATSSLVLFRRGRWKEKVV